MIVAIDAVGAKFGGAARIAVDAVDALASAPDVERVVVFTSPAESRDFTLGADGVEVIDQPEAEPATGRLAWANSGLSEAGTNAGADVILSLNAVGVSDLPVVNYYQQPLLYDEAARGKVSAELRTRLTAIRSLTWRAAKEAQAHVVQTAWMRDRVSDSWGLEVSEVVIATPAPPPWTASTGARSADVLWVGNSLGYKRWGQAQWIHGRFREFAAESRLLATLDEVSGEALVGLGHISRRELREHYGNVGALLVTSMCESLGLPLLEAMAAGCPIVAPDLPWARSVCDNAALYFDPNTPASAVERLRDAREPKVEGDLRARMNTRAESIRAENGWGKLIETLRSVA